jgi:hypothetical protein
MKSNSIILLLAAALHGSAQEGTYFDQKVAPILIEHCWDCHSGAKPKGGLDITRARSMRDGGDSGPAVFPRRLEKSLLWQRVVADEMPPKHRLNAAEKAVLRAWIEGGADWGRDPIDPFRVSTAKRAGADWWSLKPIQRPDVPNVPDGAWSRHPIDRFLLAGLDAKGLTPSPEADRRTLIRRLSFDLLGLPPTWDEVEAFTRDKRPDAYERLVDRLLASPHFGERWARHWLDVVRYGESDGFERNAPRPNAWPYRDWVVQAFNADMPYDEFCRLQLAGDVLRPNDGDAVRATGYLVAGIHNTVLPGLKRLRDAAFHDELEDLVGNVGQTFLGLTTNCARCHDHKFDPIGMRDYYRLASALSGVQHGERELRPTTTDPAPIEKQIAAVAKSIATLEERARRELRMGDGAFAPSPVAAWDFRVDLRDRVGALDVALLGGARRTDAGLVLDGNSAHAKTPPLPFALTEKTLEAWVRLDNLEQRGGGVMSVQSVTGGLFDSLVFAEKEPKRWLAGSDFFRRTQSLAGFEEIEASRQVVHMALTYRADGVISAFRNGQPYGTPYQANASFATAPLKSIVLFGIRHEPAGGNRMLAGVIERARLYDRALSAAELKASATTDVVLSERDILARLTAEERTQREQLLRTRSKLLSELGRLRTAALKQTVYAAIGKQPETMRVLHRGQVTEPGEVVAASGLAVLGPSSNFGLTPDAPEGERRRKLAEWITSADNPLFARVMVNRLWHYHFGAGFVETPSDFGFNGGKPSHPELLDWLASEFVQRGYRLKAMHRLLVTSQAYRQASRPRPEAARLDADNRLLWRKRPLRIEGEVVRDSLLAVAGLLHREIGGKGFTDYRESSGAGTTYYDPIDPVGPEFQRRSLYRFQPRGANLGLLDVFDCPDPSSSAPRRNATTTPLQALALWNGAFPLRMADALAQRAKAAHPLDLNAQITLCYRHALQREPEPLERERAWKLADEHGLPALCRALLNTNEFLTME